MGNRSNFFALVQDWLSCLCCLPYPKTFFGPFLWNGIRKFPKNLLIDIWPKFEQGKRGVEADIERSIVGIVKTFQQRKRGRKFGICSDLPPTECARWGECS